MRAQTQQPLEIIVIDDGSDDRTGEIALDAGARVITTINGGAARARNVGIEAASCEWIALLDSDDCWHPEKLELQWAAIRTVVAVDLVITDFTFVDVDGTRHEHGVAKNPGFRRTHPIDVSPGVVRIERIDAARALLHGNFVLPSTALFRRRIAIEKQALFEPRGDADASIYHTFPEDSEWSLRYFRSSDVVVVLRSLVDYAVTPSGLSANPGRVRYGDVFLMDRILSHPERYPAGIADLAFKRRPAIARSAISIYARRLELDAAVIVASHAWRATRAPREALVLALVYSFCRAPVLGVLRSSQAIWRERMKPFLRARRP